MPSVSSFPVLLQENMVGTEKSVSMIAKMEPEEWA